MNFKAIFPILEWLPNYKKSWLNGDIGAGLTVGIMLIPQGIAYAMVAGLPPIYGLYTALIPQMIYAVFGTSRQISIGPVAMDSLIVASGVAALAKIGTDRFIEFAILLALIVGVLQVLFGVFRLGFLVNFLSRPVISGFTSAAALIIGFGQLNHILGIDLKRSSRLQDILVDAIEHISSTNLITLSIALLSIVIIILVKKYLKKVPAALVVVVLGILAVKVFDLEGEGVAVIGEIPKGLPSFRMPHFDKQTLAELFPLALTLAFIAFLEAISIAKAMESKHSSYKVLPNQELFAIGLGNIIGSFFQSYPSTGGFARTAVNDQAGAKTPLAAIVSAIIIALTLLFLTPVFYSLPKAVLGAIILVAVYGLLDFKMPKQLLNYSKRDLVILNATLFATATIGIKEGIMVGVVLSIVMLVYKSTKPHMAVLGKVPGGRFYRNCKRFEDVEIEEDILIVRFDAQLYFANTTYFKEKLLEFSKAKGDKLKIIIIDGESLNALDSTAIYTLYDILKYYKSKHIQIAFTGLKGPVRDKMVKSGLMDLVGPEYFFMSIRGAVDHYNSGFKKEKKFQDYVEQSFK